MVKEAEWETLTLADGSEVKAAGRVQFKLQCGDYTGEVIARVFPHLHRELILGIPWLTSENPTIDWAKGQVTVEKKSCVLSLPLATKQKKTPTVDEVNMCSAKQMARWFRRHKVQRAFLGILQCVEDKAVVEVETEEMEIGKFFRPDLAPAIKAVLEDYKNVFPKDLPPGLPLVGRSHEFKIDLKDDEPPVHHL